MQYLVKQVLVLKSPDHNTRSGFRIKLKALVSNHKISQATCKVHAVLDALSGELAKHPSSANVLQELRTWLERKDSIGGTPSQACCGPSSSQECECPTDQGAA